MEFQNYMKDFQALEKKNHMFMIQCLNYNGCVNMNIMFTPND